MISPIKTFRLWLINRKYERYMKEANGNREEENWAALWLGCRYMEILGKPKKGKVRLELGMRKKKGR